VDFPPTVDPYEKLKDRLLPQLQLSKYEKMTSLGRRKTSAMLAAMLELSPRGVGNS
jgi:hypothetical protein